jgi:hypothetical protein
MAAPKPKACDDLTRVENHEESLVRDPRSGALPRPNPISASRQTTILSE